MEKKTKFVNTLTSDPGKVPYTKFLEKNLSGPTTPLVPSDGGTGEESTSTTPTSV